MENSNLAALRGISWRSCQVFAAVMQTRLISWQDEGAMQIAAQLYTLRDFTKTKAGLVDCLDRLSATGYEGVQFSAVGCMEGDAPEVTAEEAGRLLKERDLICCATHRPLSRLIDEPEAESAFHAALDCGYTAIGSPGAGYAITSPEDWARLAGDLNRALDALAGSGLKLGYHNHAMEWQRLGEEKVHPFEILLRTASPHLEFELDTYWAAFAGQDPAAIIRRLEGRISMVHVKDLEPVEWQVTYAPVGEGNLNWDDILAACLESGTEWLIVEQDTCRRDPFDCLESSLRFLQNHPLV